MRHNEDPEAVLEHALSGLSGKDNFAFQGKTEVKSAGHPVQEALKFDGFVVNHNQMYIKTRRSFALHAGGQGKSAESENWKAGNSTIYIKNNNNWIRSNKGTAADNFPEMLRMWNPMVRIEQINKLKKRVAIDRKLSDSKHTVLNIRMNSAAMKSMMRTELTRQLSVDKLMKQVRQGNDLSGQEAASMRAELERNMMKAKAELEEMLSTLSLDARYLMWVDNTTSLPQRMVVESTMKYVSGGVDRQEAIRAEYDFKDYDKDFIIPQ